VGVPLWVDDEGYMNDLEVFGYGPDIHGRPSTTMHGWPTVESFERREQVSKRATSGDGLGNMLRRLFKRAGRGNS